MRDWAEMAAGRDRPCGEIACAVQNSTLFSFSVNMSPAKKDSSKSECENTIVSFRVDFFVNVFIRW